jgi:hypothetical protein
MWRLGSRAHKKLMLFIGSESRTLCYLKNETVLLRLDGSSELTSIPNKPHEYEISKLL